MKQKIKTILKCILVIVLFCCGELSCGNAKTERYTGIDERTSTEIRLTLAPNQTFIMTNRLQDNNSQEQAKQETITGKWVREGKLLKLNSVDKNIIIYEKTTDNSIIAGHKLNVEIYVFKTNTKDFFASKIDVNLDVAN